MTCTAMILILLHDFQAARCFSINRWRMSKITSDKTESAAVLLGHGCTMLYPIPLARLQKHPRSRTVEIHWTYPWQTWWPKAPTCDCPLQLPAGQQNSTHAVPRHGTRRFSHRSAVEWDVPTWKPISWTQPTEFTSDIQQLSVAMPKTASHGWT